MGYRTGQGRNYHERFPCCVSRIVDKGVCTAGGVLEIQKAVYSVQHFIVWSGLDQTEDTIFLQVHLAVSQHLSYGLCSDVYSLYLANKKREKKQSAYVSALGNTFAWYHERRASCSCACSYSSLSRWENNLP